MQIFLTGLTFSPWIIIADGLQSDPDLLSPLGCNLSLGLEGGNVASIPHAKPIFQTSFRYSLLSQLTTDVQNTEITTPLTRFESWSLVATAKCFLGSLESSILYAYAYIRQLLVVFTFPFSSKSWWIFVSRWFTKKSDLKIRISPLQLWKDILQFYFLRMPRKSRNLRPRLTQRSINWECDPS